MDTTTLTSEQLDELRRMTLPMAMIHPPPKPEPPKMVYPSQCSQSLLREFMREVIKQPHLKKDSNIAYIMNQVKTRRPIPGGNAAISDILSKIKAKKE
jgi:hypothetical protein